MALVVVVVVVVIVVIGRKSPQIAQILDNSNKHELHEIAIKHQHEPSTCLLPEWFLFV